MSANHQAGHYNNEETSDVSELNLNFNAFVKPSSAQRYNSHVASPGDDARVTSPSMTSSPSQSPHIPPVSSFIKNSDAVLYPSSPTSDISSPRKFLPSHQELLQRARISSASDLGLNVEQQQQTSSSPLLSRRLHISAPTLEPHSRSRSISLQADHQPLLSRSQSMSRPSPNRISPRQDLRKNVYNVKTEAIDPLPPSHKIWANNVTPTVFSFENEQAHSYNNERLYSRNGIDQMPFVSTNGVLNGNVGLKQEKFYPIEQFNQSMTHNTSPLQPHAPFRPTTQTFFPGHQFDFTLLPKTAEASHDLLQSHLQSSPHCQSANSTTSRPFQTALSQHRPHPYANFTPNYPGSINGTIPYKPRYSRRNNPDLEKKRIHKCDHAGKKFSVFKTCNCLEIIHLYIVYKIKSNIHGIKIEKALSL